jgi:hypothetical protein
MYRRDVLLKMWMWAVWMSMTRYWTSQKLKTIVIAMSLAAATSLVENTLEEASPVTVLGISNGRPVCSAVKEGTAGIKGFGTGSGTADISALGFSMF